MCLPKFRNDVCDTRGADISIFSGRRVDLIGVVNENHEKLIFSSVRFEFVDRSAARGSLERALFIPYCSACTR